jgi:hypothetical protein
MKLLIILALGFAVMFGIVSPKKAFKKIGMMLILPLILTIGWGLLSETWDNISYPERIVFLVSSVVVVLAVVLIGTRFGREVLASMIGHFLYDTIKSVVTFPSRFLRFLLRRH